MTPRFLTIILLSFLSTVVLAEQIANVSLDQAWGLLIGDEITVQVELPVAVSELDVSSLPEKDVRYGAWLYLKERSTKDNMVWLTYQIVNVPVENTKVFTPEFSLRLLNDEWITVPALPLTIGSSLVKNLDSTVPKADHRPILIDTALLKQRLISFAVIAVIASLLLFIWHVGWQPKQRKPFAQAVYDLKHLKWRVSAKQQQAARLLHAAFNRTADTVVIVAELDVLFKQAPWLHPLEKEISAFYQNSANYFFTQNPGQQPDIELVIKLAKACRSKEKLV